MIDSRKVDYCTDSRSVYDKFCLLNPNIDITYQKWKEIIRTHNTFLRDYIATTGEKVKLPRGLGALAITKYKKKKVKIIDGKEYVNLSVDWGKSRGTGRLFYHMNTHTDGYNFKWYWFVSEAKGIPFSTIWQFKPARASSRDLAKYIMKIGVRNFDKYKIYRISR